MQVARKCDTFPEGKEIDKSSQEMTVLRKLENNMYQGDKRKVEHKSRSGNF